MVQRWNLGIDTSINHTFTQLDFTNSCQAPADHAQFLQTIKNTLGSGWP